MSKYIQHATKNENNGKFSFPEWNENSIQGMRILFRLFYDALNGIIH